MCLSDNSEKSLTQFQSFENHSLMTTKELAQVLGVSIDTVTRVANKVIDPSAVLHRVINGGKSKVFTEEQATIIMQEIQKHHNLESRQIDNVSTDYEMELMTQKVLAYHVQKANEYKLRAEKAEQKVIEQKPKVDWYDNVADSSNLTEIGTVGKMTNIGSQKFFKSLRADKIIYQKTDSDGITYDVPFYDYEKYFKTVPEPFIKGDKKCVRNKLLFTQAGVIWATNKYKAKDAFTIKEVSEILNLEIDEILQFLNIKHYIKLHDYDYTATDLGLSYGYMVIKDGFICVTKKCFDKIKNGFCQNELTAEERKRVDEICAEAEKTMKRSAIGLAE